MSDAAQRHGHALPMPRTILDGTAWPAVPTAGAATLFALAYQLDRSQWLSEAALQQHQLTELGALLDHALASVPFYRDRLRGLRELGEPLTFEAWRRIPILRRIDAAAAGDALLALPPPRSHGAIRRLATSGTTGTPLAVAKSELESLFWQAFVLREELWHRRDWKGTLAVIRDDPLRGSRGPEGAVLPDWGKPLADLYPTGPAYILDVHTDLGAQAEWLARHDPHYLLSTADNLRWLAERFRGGAHRLTRLREARAIGDRVDDSLRGLCREVWNVPVTDLYSCTEIGTMALQCPEHGKLHAQMEGAMIEIVDEAGNPCAPGAVGEVVATSLHNYAMPLIRYAVGDRAEAGAPCACGRGLTTIARILGRA